MMSFEDAMKKANEYLNKADCAHWSIGERADFARIARTYIEFAKELKKKDKEEING